MTDQGRQDKPAWVLTFYSYKGGVGRTLALTNVARYMTEELGYRIGLVDLDTESPGLSNEPLSWKLDSIKGGTGEAAVRAKQEKAELIKTIHKGKGFIELFTELYHYLINNLDAYPARTSSQDINPTIAQGALSGFWEKKRIIDYMTPLPVAGNGDMFLMPAGQRSDAGYLLNFDNFDQFSQIINSEKDRWVLPILTGEILQRFIEALHLDYIFIDGRTGVSPFFHVYGYSIPHALVLFTGLNEQNIEGSLAIIENARARGVTNPAPVFLVASPVPTVNPEALEERLAVVRERLKKIPAYKDSIYNIPRQINFILPYVDLASYLETYFIRRYPHLTLSREYIRLASAIESLGEVSHLKQHSQVRRNEDSLISRIQIIRKNKDSSNQGVKADTVKIAAEDILHEKFLHLIQNRLGCENVGWERGGPNDRFGVRKFRSAGGGGREPFNIELHFWEATNKKAPWEGLTGMSSDDSLFDIVLIPQSYVGSLNTDRIWRFDQIRKEFKELSSRYSVLNYEFLDRWYPGWRRRCSFKDGVAGLPYSANTTLLCANYDLLKQLCREFWANKGFESDTTRERDAFFPSSWNLLRDLLQTTSNNSERSWRPFAIAEQGRGLYYEWMNVVLAQGGGDLEVVEGDVVTDYLIDKKRTREGTLMFLELALEASQASNTREESMVGVQTRFANGDIALYVAWSDSFLFDHESQIMRPANPEPDNRIQNHSGIVNTQLGMIPRDMRFRRRPLVAGWLMVFPKWANDFSEEKTRIEFALTFADLFLDPGSQEYLLRKGFPSFSLPIVENELRLLEGEPSDYVESMKDGWGNRFRPNYKVFLKSQHSALLNGHWVPSVTGSSEIVDWVSEALEKVVWNCRQQKIVKSSSDDLIFSESFQEKIRRRMNGNGSRDK